MKLGERQRLFAKLLPRLIDKAYELGYEITLGEAWRPPETAAAYDAAGKGISNSLHIDKLAIDLNLFKDGVYLPHTQDHEPLGIFWESLHSECRWGGRFNDGNHYSITYNGRK